MKKELMPIDSKDVDISQERLSELEATIREGSQAYLEVGRALTEIRETNGYKLRGYKTFLEYCEKVHGISDRHGRRLMQAVETADAINKVTGKTLGSESVAREFAPIASDPKKIERVSAVLEKKGFSVVTATADAVKEAVQRLSPKLKPAPTTANGKTVVLPAHTWGKPAYLSTAPAPAATEPGACPHCHEVPQSYDRADEVWLCHDCGGVVMLTLQAWPPKNGNGHKPAAGPTCPTCKKPIGDGDVFCNACGSIL